MKTVEEYIKEIESSETLKNELKAVKDKDTLAAFLKKNNVDAPTEEFVKAFKEKKEAEGELADDDAENVAGGKWFFW